MAQRSREQRNLLTMVPERSREWRRSDAGDVRVLEPRFGRSRPGRWLARYLRMRDIEIKLDEFGGAVWEACDGRATVAEIAAELRGRFGDRVEPVDERLGRFFARLEHTRLIRWRV
jgi:hypothetical protein